MHPSGHVLDGGDLRNDKDQLAQFIDQVMEAQLEGVKKNC